MDDELDVPLGEMIALARSWGEQADGLALTCADLGQAPTDGFSPASRPLVTDAVETLVRRAGDAAHSCHTYADTIGDVVRDAWRTDGEVGDRLRDLLLGLDR